jgi:hypothetical protein
VREPHVGVASNRLCAPGLAQGRRRSVYRAKATGDSKPTGGRNRVGCGILAWLGRQGISPFRAVLLYLAYRQVHPKERRRRNRAPPRRPPAGRQLAPVSAACGAASRTPVGAEMFRRYRSRRWQCQVKTRGIGVNPILHPGWRLPRAAL